MSTAAISIQHLHKRFGHFSALTDINLDIPPGQIFGLLGPNGAGKTTLIRLLAGVTASSEGTLTILDMDPVKQKQQVRQLIGYMPQAAALYEDLSARDNVLFFGRAHQVTDLDEKVTQALTFVGLQERADADVYTFSGGMKQRVSLACALVHQPRVLFLDEPTAGVDPQLRQTFWEHFRRLAAEGSTILVSTHQMDEALQCDTLAILHEGVLLATAPPQELLWQHHAELKVWQKEALTLSSDLVNYPDKLPQVLQQYGLDPAITRIELSEEKLEAVVLRLILAHKQGRAA